VSTGLLVVVHLLKRASAGRLWRVAMNRRPTLCFLLSLANARPPERRFEPWTGAPVRFTR